MVMIYAVIIIIIISNYWMLTLSQTIYLYLYIYIICGIYNCAHFTEEKIVPQEYHEPCSRWLESEEAESELKLGLI